MGLDIKFPIGLMFAIFGVILTVQGILSIGSTELYEKSLNVNVNLWSGLFMLIFGSLMLLFSVKKKKTTGG
ncbi:MAG TPA: hypothetical protein VJ346_09730 [Bacteroidales bacterium]|nr:hypothetical protein [Bacteroidales bacterium]